jgi:glycosyltransferase involved in cell wall biosynthesis
LVVYRRHTRKTIPASNRHLNFRRTASNSQLRTSCTDQKGNQKGIPNVLKETMDTGMPLISTNHVGIPELVEAKVSGLLVPIEKTKEVL